LSKYWRCGWEQKLREGQHMAMFRLRAGKKAGGSWT